jgi:integrase/recombinase XerD
MALSECHQGLLGSTEQRYAEFHSLFKSPAYQPVVDEATSVIFSENWRVTHYTSIDFIALTRPYETLRSLVRFTRLIDGHFAIHDTVGMTPRTIQRILKRIANKAHINRPVCPHVLRHTFAVAAVQKGISLPALQRLLGHDRLTTTEIYLNLSPEDVIREFREKW